MAKLTLLDMVQDILNDTDSDLVNSINDTVESLQAAQIVKTSYFELMASRNWPHLRASMQLDSVSDTNRPTHLKLPVGVKELIFFNYNKPSLDNPGKPRFDKVNYLDPEAFLAKTNKRNLQESNIIPVVDFGGGPILIRIDKQPSYYTSFDDEYLVTDSFESSAGGTLSGSNTQCLAYLEPIWTVSDTFVPDLPADAFPSLLAEAKSTAFMVLKQVPNQKAEQKARRQQRWLARNARKIAGGIRYENYGRGSRTQHTNRSTLIDKDGTA